MYLTFKKACTKCGLEKIASQDPALTEFNAKTRWPDKKPKTWFSWCVECQREDARERARRRRRAAGIKPRTKMDPRTARERRNELKRKRYRERMENDPEYVANRREYVRIYEADRRRARGAKPRQFKKGAFTLENGYKPNLGKSIETIPCDSFIAWVNRIASQLDGGVSELADLVGVDEARFRAIKRQGRVSVAFVDKCLIAVGSDKNLYDLYPDL